MAEQAAQWRLIWQVVDDTELMTSVLALARTLATQPTRGFALQKQAFAASLSNSLADQIELEARLQAIAGRTEDYREGVNSFFEKRNPVFGGR